MRHVFACAILCLSGLCAVPSDNPDAAPPGFDDSAVLVQSGDSSGSGVAVRRGPREFVWTAAHVVSDAQKIREVVDPQTGQSKTVVEFDDVVLYRQTKGKDGLPVLESRVRAEVLRYSDLEFGYDLALLLAKQPSCPKGAVFADKGVAVGSRLYHVGSPGGIPGYNSYIPGLLSSRGRPTRGLWHDWLRPTLGMDQYSMAIAPGSSGGPVFDRQGRVVGLVTQAYTSQNTVSFGVPVEEIRKYASECKAAWAVDDLPVPDVIRLASPRTTPVPKPKP